MNVPPTGPGPRNLTRIQAAGGRPDVTDVDFAKSPFLAIWEQQMLEQVRSGTPDVITDPRASPTGFPFKVVSLAGTNSETQQYALRERVCDLGYLRTAYRREDGRIGYRCAAEPVDAFVKKGGAVEDTEGRKCLCNGLMTNVGHGQLRAEGVERALITSGDDLLRLKDVLGSRHTLSAGDVIDYLMGVGP